MRFILRRSLHLSLSPCLSDDSLCGIVRRVSAHSIRKLISSRLSADGSDATIHIPISERSIVVEVDRDIGVVRSLSFVYKPVNQTWLGPNVQDIRRSSPGSRML